MTVGVLGCPRLALMHSRILYVPEQIGFSAMCIVMEIDSCSQDLVSVTLVGRFRFRMPAMYLYKRHMDLMSLAEVYIPKHHLAPHREKLEKSQFAPDARVEKLKKR